VLSDDADKSWGSITTELLEQQKCKCHGLVKGSVTVLFTIKKWIMQNDGNGSKKQHFVLT
jgi:hypothetical protein